MDTNVRYDASPVQTAAAVVALVFGLVGIAGFIPGVTTNFDALEFAGHESEAQLLGLFQVSVLHNLVHLGFAVAGFALARTVAGARAYLIGGGLLYLLVLLWGLLVGAHDDANLLPLNEADDMLHAALGLGMLLLGLALGRPRTMTGTGNLE